jgi:hypothetical protein
MQEYVAFASVGASTVRGQRAPGLVASCRAELQRENLSAFSTNRPDAFARAIDRETARIQSALPRNGRSWGIARKVLNIFLRNALYNVCLHGHYKFRSVESLLEIALDGMIVRGLKKQSPPRSLPRWRGIKYVTPEESAAFQARSQEIALERGTHRVHLDAALWMDRR